MKLAVYKEKQYEYEELSENRIRLLSNTWQEDFYEYRTEKNYYYAKEVGIEELEIRREATIYLKMGKQDAECLVYDSVDGETVGFLRKEQIPEKISGEIKTDNCFAGTIPLKRVKEIEKNASVRYKVGLLEEDSYSDRKLIPPLAVDVSARLLNLSADKTTTTCRSCGTTYPVKNADVKYDTTYETTCPLCGIAQMNRRK